jgi:hypothetical protein
MWVKLGSTALAVRGSSGPRAFTGSGSSTDGPWCRTESGAPFADRRLLDGGESRGYAEQDVPPETLIGHD